MKVACPTCGAEVEFRYDDSFVRVCGHCRSAVVRTDRGVDTLGKFADLVPIDSPLRLFAEGRYGTTGFLLIGMAQLRHAAGGVWQEWYAKLDGGQWAWISEAQGRLYLTFERPDVPAPNLAMLAPGAQLELAGTMFTVAERGTATYVSALGEIPYRLVPGSTFQFADLSDGRGGFATIDYGDGSDAPAVYLGYQVTPQGLGISGGEAQPQLARPAQAARLACPNCNGSLELRAPDQTLRVACPYCDTLVNVESGQLSIIAKQAKHQKPPIPLGTPGKFAEGELTVIGYLARSAYVDHQWWPFEEYLLYAPGVGFRWLVCSDGHWSYVQPVAPGAVRDDGEVRYDGVKFEQFQSSVLRVDAVFGELYWRVQIGERAEAIDYIAPPAMLSLEATQDELSWSLSTYLTAAEVEQAFGKPLPLPAQTGIGPNQPGPAGHRKVMAVLGVAFLAVAIGKCASAPAAEKLSHTFTAAYVAPSTASDPAVTTSAGGDPSGTVMFSEPFALEGGRNVEIDLRSPIYNNWLYVALDLVNEDTGRVTSFDKSLEYYAGTSDGESWTEGSQTASEVMGPVEPGKYVLRAEVMHGGPGSMDLAVVVRQGVFRWFWFLLFGGLLGLVFAITGLRVRSFERRRWENSNVRPSAGSSSDDEEDDDDD